MLRLRTTKDVRGQLQSHGLNGVQQRHYDMHEYLEEKRAALQILGVHTGRLEGDGGDDSASTAHKTNNDLLLLRARLDASGPEMKPPPHSTGVPAGPLVALPSSPPAPPIVDGG
jgi:hypothetical protein